jgi:hypothetical protein
MKHAYEDAEYPLSGYPEEPSTFNEKLAEQMDLDEDFEEVEREFVLEVKNTTQEDIVVAAPEGMPAMSSPEWSDWVLSQLTKDEMYDGKPTCDGLRRVAIMVFGPMDILPPKVHAINEQYAALTVTLRWPKREVSGSAEVHVNNTDAPFSQYPLGSGETRAQSRALRFALNLRKVVTAEEVSRKADISVPITDENRTEGGITSTQSKFIELMCKKNDISVRGSVEAAVGAHDALSDLTYAEAEQVQELLDTWAKERPDEVESFDPDWKSSF